jgi:hypothetical protein
MVLLVAAAMLATIAEEQTEKEEADRILVTSPCKTLAVTAATFLPEFVRCIF